MVNGPRLRLVQTPSKGAGRTLLVLPDELVELTAASLTSDYGLLGIPRQIDANVLERQFRQCLPDDHDWECVVVAVEAGDPRRERLLRWVHEQWPRQTRHYALVLSAEVTLEPPELTPAEPRPSDVAPARVYPLTTPQLARGLEFVESKAALFDSCDEWRGKRPARPLFESAHLRQLVSYAHQASRGQALGSAALDDLREWGLCAPLLLASLERPVVLAEPDLDDREHVWRPLAFCHSLAELPYWAARQAGALGPWLPPLVDQREAEPLQVTQPARLGSRDPSEPPQAPAPPRDLSAPQAEESYRLSWLLYQAQRVLSPAARRARYIRRSEALRSAQPGE